MKRFIALAVFALSAGACGQADHTASSADVSPQGQVEEGQPTAVEESLQQADAEAGAPRDTLQDWADAMDARNWEQARAFWGDNGEKSGMTLEEFAAANEKYRTISVTLGEGQEEGAAGSLYYEAQVTMEGELQNGEAYVMRGPVVLRRVNEVPGASMEDRMWHIETSDLRPVPVEQE